MNRALLPAGLLLAILAATAAAPQSEPRQQAFALLQAAQDLVKAGQYAAAEQKLQAARELDPRYPDVYLMFGYLYSSMGDRARALEAYGQLLTLKPDSDYGRKEIRRLFYSGEFPRSVRAPYLAFSGVGFANEEVRLQAAAGTATRRLAYTTSLLFHEDMKGGGGPVEIALPVTGDEVRCLVNRSRYGFLLPPDNDRYKLALALSYPSETLPPSRDLSPLATSLTHLLLRFLVYDRAYLGPPEGLADGTLVNAYLCPAGPTGAETYKQSLYFYDVGTERSSVEWARQAAHEMGHLLLPPIGRFASPESFASGFLGERLLMQYLALEAGLSAGEPWPSPAAQQTLNALWPGEEFQLATYLQANCRASLDYFLAAGPNSPLAAGPDAPGGLGAGNDGLQYYLGFMLWVQAGFGPELLRPLLPAATTTAPLAPKDCLAAFRMALRKQADKGPLRLDAGSLNLAASKLQSKPLEGALGRTNVRLAPGDSACFTMYLPAGAWNLSTLPAGAGLSLTIDGKGPLPFTDGGVSLGRLDDGWHSLVIQASDQAAPLTLDKLVFTPEKET